MGESDCTDAVLWDVVSWICLIELVSSLCNCRQASSIAAKIYNALLLNRIEPEIEKILVKNQNFFYRNWSTTSQILTIRQILEGVRAKKNLTYTFICTILQDNWLHTRGKMEQILLAYSLPRETVATIMMLSKNTKLKIRPLDGDTDFFDIVPGVPQGDTLAPYLFIVYQDYVLRTSMGLMKEYGLHWKGQESNVNS